MSKTIWVCSRKEFRDTERERLLRICRKLEPDNIDCKLPNVVICQNVAFGITNPTSTQLIQGSSLLLGKLFGDYPQWHVPRNAIPEGTFALFRDGNDFCELATDAVASRTIWYYMNEELFIAATSQRAILLYIGGFELNNQVIPWMLSTGSLGPTCAWDTRINRLAPDSSIVLNKHEWTIETHSNLIKIKPVSGNKTYHEVQLKAALDSTFTAIDIDYSQWAIALTGGYDSRGILHLLNSNQSAQTVRTITWGDYSSLHKLSKDAIIARKVAQESHAKHTYFHSHIPTEPMQTLLSRFLRNGEGRMDYLVGGMDGFAICKQLFDHGVQGVIIGDEGFGLSAVSSPSDVRFTLGFGLCSDFENLKGYTSYGLPPQIIPESFKQCDNESLEEWRDRLYHQFRLPTIMAGLSDLMLPYVEVIHPLLSREIITQVRKLPDNLRTNKALFKRIVGTISPQIPFVPHVADAALNRILRRQDVIDVLIQELSSTLATTIFPVDFLHSVLDSLKNSGNRQYPSRYQWKPLVKQYIPSRALGMLKNIASPVRRVDDYVLAFRIYIMIAMKRLLCETC